MKRTIALIVAIPLIFLAGIEVNITSQAHAPTLAVSTLPASVSQAQHVATIHTDATRVVIAASDSLDASRAGDTLRYSADYPHSAWLTIVAIKDGRVTIWTWHGGTVEDVP